jgi:maltose-binding protein MalE
MKTKKKAIRRILSFSSLESRDTSIPIEGVKEHSKVTKRKCPSPDIGAGHSLVNSISKKVCCSQTLATGVVPDKLQQLSTNATNTSIPIEGVKQHGIVTKRKCAQNDIGGSHSLVNSVSKKICCSQTFASKVVPDELRPISTDAISGDLHANQIGICHTAFAFSFI